MYRLFIAVDIPDKIKNKISKCYCGIEKVKWMKKENLHITLEFLGDTGIDEYYRIIDVLNSISFNSFNLSLKDMGTFSKRGKISTVWLGLNDNTHLIELNNIIKKRLNRSGLNIKTGHYRPHITIARLRRGCREDDIIPFLKYNHNFLSHVFEVNDFKLYSSVIYPEGSKYKVEEVFNLK